MLILMGFFTEAAKNGVKLDYNTQIEMVFKTLSADFVSFRPHITVVTKSYNSPSS